MFVVDRVELILVDEPLKMGDLECDHTVRRKQMRHSCGEVVEIRDLRQHIVADDEICLPPLGHELLRKLQAEKLDESGNILLARRLGHIGGWLDADHRNAQRQEVLKQISVVASDLKHLTLRTKTKPDLYHFAIPARMIDPKRRIRRKIRDFSENMLWFDILPQLHKKAFAADEHMQRVIRFHLVDLISRQKAFAKGRHAEINEACCQRSMT